MVTVLTLRWGLRLRICVMILFVDDFGFGLGPVLAEFVFGLSSVI